MASTVLTIVGDARGARRAIADVRADHARASAAMGADDRRAARERRRAEAEEVADARRQLRAMQNARSRAARERQQSEARERRARETAARQEAAARGRAERQELAGRQRVEREKTRAAVSEARKREREAARESRERRREEQRVTREFEREVRERARIAQRELNERRRAERRAADQGRRAAERGQRQGTRTAVDAATTAAGAVASFGADVRGQMEGARSGRAALQGQVIDAVSQVGVTDLREVDRYVEMIRARAIQEGMRSEDFAGAIGQAQTEFSALGAMESLGGAGNARARAAVFQRAIDTAAKGRNMGVDPGEFSRLMGMLNNQGLDSSTQDRLAAWTVGAAQRGAIEPGAVTREAMGPIIQRMQAAMAQAAPADRARAAEEAYRQAFSEIQVLRGAGESARLSSTAMANWNRALANPGTQSKMRENVSHIADRDQRRRVQAALFDRDGSLRAELRNPLALTGALQGAGVSDPTQMANIFAGTGAGNAQSLQANFRRMMMGLAGNGGVEKVRALMDASTAVSPERIAALAAMRRGSEQAQLNRNEESRDKALTDNTSELVKLNRSFTDWTARNPVASSAGTAATTAAAGFFGPRILEHIFGGGAGAGAGAAARIAGIGGRAMPFLGAAMTALGIANDVRQGRSAGQVAVGAVGDLFAGGAAVGGVAGAGGLAAAAARQRGGGGDAALRADVAQAMVDGLSRARIVARVDPHDAEVAATRARAGGGG